MPLKKTQSEIFKQEFDNLLERHATTATKKDIKEALDVFIKNYNKLAALLTEKMAENKAEMSAETARFGKEVAGLEKRLRKLVDSIETKGGKTLEQVKKEILQEVKRVEARILPETDLSELYERLTRHEGKMNDMSMLQKAENIRNALELLEGDERLKASAISGLEEMIEQIAGLKKAVGALQGAHQTPSPVHWPRHESFTMNGSATTVTLSQAVGAAGTAIFGVRYNGQTLDIDNQYTVNGNVITFDFTPINGSTISVSYYG